MTQRFSKTTLALALAAGLMLPVLAPAEPALAHEAPCPPGFVLSGDLGSDPADRNDNNILCANQRSAQQIVIDDHVHPEPDPK
jgi:hypothetical protein